MSGGPWYVVAKDTKKNVVYISRDYYADDKPRDTFIVDQLNWITGVPKKRNLRMKIRHGATFHDCVIAVDEQDKVHVKLAQRDQGIAPGQFAVFYDGGVCLGGGIIFG